MAIFNASSSIALPLSPGDRVEVSIPQETYFSRVYEVNEEGNLEIPYLGTVAVAGLELDHVEDKLAYSLVNQGFFPPNTLQMTIQVIEWSPITVQVAGELFQPGAMQINLPYYPEESAVSPDANQITGEFPYRRYLTDALEAAGGVLPTANVKEIRLIRNGNEQIFDLSGALTGEPFENVPLISGDRIIVPAAERFQAELVRPSAITRPGIKVFVSNLTVPATSNATSAIGNTEEGITFPYGARFSQAVIATNCAGGTKSVNADRKAVLVRVDRLTGETNHLERGVEDLLRDSHNNDDNPLLMPRDGVACYDSKVTNIRDIFQTLGDIINPLNGLF
ncbi:polysaccharide export protein [Waterburya agarophytonicola K14]|uniref:Polysaccharide export protein n=1 Tax=Waterburya agarophytonicola KI4 TaxID=2874699 RepID=A0A964FL90_9CYAN|nr:polysaccharide biosynthesis/export family protein [Waterburya agarophytonicola]MCC0179233.1 polysaccharide export protein [Waterburya agarophytonicola KI4]